MLADRAAGPRTGGATAAAAPKGYELEGSMSQYVVAPTRAENFRAGIGSGVYEWNERTNQMENRFTNAMRNMVEAGRQTAESLDRGFGNFFDSLIDNPREAANAFKSMTSSILSDMAKILARQAIINPLVGAIGGMLGIQPSAPVTAGVKHSGGLVGVGGQSRLVSGMMFAAAPRLHSGLAPDEYPAILQHGERVIPKGGSGDSPVIINTTINVDGSRGGSPEQNQALGGEIARQFEQMIDERLTLALRPRGILTGR
jgi:hypothetical protein